MVRKLPAYARLVWALLRDTRVPPQPKLILAAIVGYLILPFDVIPDFLPILGQLDDLAVVLLGLEMFIRSVPRDLVDEHLGRIARDEDDLRGDLESVQRLLGDRFTKIRANLDQILERQRGRFRDADEAGKALARWQERRREPGDRGRKGGVG